MSNMTAEVERCGVCGGSRESHDRADVKHAFRVDGQLQSKEQAAKEAAQSTPRVIRLPGAQTNEAGAIGRLVELLMEKGVLSGADALYVAGMGQKPSEQYPGYLGPESGHLWLTSGDS